MTQGKPRSPSSVIQLRYRLESALESAPSRTGRQIDNLQAGLAPTGSGSGGSLDESRLDLADQVRLMRDLSPDEETVCRLRFCSDAGVEGYKRLASTWQIEDAERYHGETLVPGKQGRVPDNPHLRWVEGVRARLPSFEEIAKALVEQGHTPRDGAPEVTSKWVKAKYGNALRKVQRAQEERL